jgi:hypothetical protein
MGRLFEVSKAIKLTVAQIIQICEMELQCNIKYGEKLKLVEVVSF